MSEKTLTDSGQNGGGGKRGRLFITKYITYHEISNCFVFISKLISLQMYLSVYRTVTYFKHRHKLQYKIRGVKTFRS